MKKLTLITSLFLFFSIFIFTSCTQKREKNNVSVTVTDQTLLGDNFDLQAFTTLLTSTTDAESLEKQINDPTVGINNLDLNEDGSVDYVQVTTYGEGDKKGISLTISINESEIQEIAQVEITKTGEVNVHGNKNIYGTNGHYTSHMSVGEAMFLAWMFSPRYNVYNSPYYYGNYPSHYNSYKPVTHTVYVTRTTEKIQKSSVKTTKSTKQPTIKSPNENKTSKTVSKKNESLKTQSSTKKQFSKTDNSSKKTNTAFGDNSNTTKSKNNSPSTARKSNNNKSKSWTAPSKSSGGTRSSGSRRSDVRAKHLIIYLNDGTAMDRISQLSPCTYFYKNTFINREGLPCTMQYGLIAQDVQKILPAMVTADADGYLNVDYTQLTVVNTQALKELLARIEEIENILKENNYVNQ